MTKEGIPGYIIDNAVYDFLTNHCFQFCKVNPKLREDLCGECEVFKFTRKYKRTYGERKLTE